MINKNDHFIGECIDYSYLGLGVVKHEGFCLFVKGMLVGEVGEIVVTTVKKDHGFGRLLKLQKTSSARVESDCPYYPMCGGCQLLHMSYDEQLSFKQHYIEQLMSKALKTDIKIDKIKGMEQPYHYRNKVQIPLETNDNQIVGGFYRYNSHDIVPIENCILQSDKSNLIYRKIMTLLNKYHIKDVIKHVLIKHGFSSDQIMIVFIINQNHLPYETEIVDHLSSDPLIKSIIVNVNKRSDNVILGNDEKVIYGKDHITDDLMGYNFSISSKSFYQINSKQTEVLYQIAYDMAKLSKEDTLLDLYCGIGTIGLIASQYVKEVVGIEIVEQAVKDAENNALLNKVTNTSFYTGEAKDVAQRLLEDGKYFNVIFVDPPRKGLDDVTIETIIKLNPERLVYISCNPATLARDLVIFDQKGYKVKKIQPVDMFPNTYHVETVVLMCASSEAGRC